jgi:phenylalanyl-tRNA synthetase beta chain
MKLSVNWLKQFVPEFDNDEVDQIAERMSIALTEVEAIYEVADKLENIYAGEILEIVPHPKRDKIRVVNVRIGSNEEKGYEILCGASNIKVGNIVPVAVPGAKVYDATEEGKTLEIGEKDIAGVVSHGMLCSQKELGIGDDHSGIYILPDQTEIGTDIRNIIYDTVIEIENKGLTHRPDCFAHVGIAREIAVQNSLHFQAPEESQLPVQTLDIELSANNKEPLLCKRYSMIAISDVKIGESPLWLKIRLQAAGMRPVNNIVDITNYVMLETGQPSHAYDYDKIKGHKLTMRQAQEGEKVTTLDGDQRDLMPGMLVNCDEEKIVGIAGVMGAQNSEISNSTKTIILQVENFEMFGIRRTTRELGLRTEASTRFEKGLDPNNVGPSMLKLVEMITDIAGGEVASEIIDIYTSQEEPKEIKFRLSEVKKRIGLDIQLEKILEILENLGLTILTDRKSIELDSEIELKIPTFRRDLNISEDIVEEIIRIYGYDRLDFELPKRYIKPIIRNKKFEIEKKITKSLAASGFSEIYSYAFVGEDLYKKCLISVDDNVQIRNPLSPELEYFRDTILPSLIQKASINSKRFEKINIFEISKVAYQKKDPETDMNIQPKMLAALSTDRKEDEDIFQNLKTHLVTVLFDLGIQNVRFENVNGEIPFKKTRLFHPRKTALIYAENEQIGIIGIVNPVIADNFEIDSNISAFEINIDLVAQIADEKTEYKALSQYQEVYRDISFWISESIEVGEIVGDLYDLDKEKIIEISVSDVYRDDKKRAGEKSVTLEITLQSMENTLSEKEITDLMDTITNTLNKKFKAETRG